MAPTLGKGSSKGGKMRRLAVIACALGLLLALPGSASASEVIDVPATAVFRAGNNGTNNCTAFLFLQWPEQEKAQAWRLEREYLKGTANIFTHDEVNLHPPFDDEPTGIWEWVPPARHHWYLHTFRSKSDASGDPVECASLQAEMLGRVISATVHVTVPDRPEEEEKEKEKEEEEEEEEKREEEEKSIPRPPNVPEGPPGKKGKATCRGKTPTIFAEPGPPTNGTARRDVIVGTPKRDIIRAHGGNAADRLFGGAAADRLFGQAGADALNGGSGRPDLCNGGSGRDERSSPGCERRQQIP